MSDKSKAPKPEEINLDDLEQVTGAGNSFEGVERVKTKER